MHAVSEAVLVLYQEPEDLFPELAHYLKVTVAVADVGQLGVLLVEARGPQEASREQRHGQGCDHHDHEDDLLKAGGVGSLSDLEGEGEGDGPAHDARVPEEHILPGAELAAAVPDYAEELDEEEGEEGEQAAEGHEGQQQGGEDQDFGIRVAQQQDLEADVGVDEALGEVAGGFEDKTDAALCAGGGVEHADRAHDDAADEEGDDSGEVEQLCGEVAEVAGEHDEADFLAVGVLCALEVEGEGEGEEQPDEHAEQGEHQEAQGDQAQQRGRDPRLQLAPVLHHRLEQDYRDRVVHYPLPEQHRVQLGEALPAHHRQDRDRVRGAEGAGQQQQLPGGQPAPQRVVYQSAPPVHPPEAGQRPHHPHRQDHAQVLRENRLAQRKATGEHDGRQQQVENDIAPEELALPIEHLEEEGAQHAQQDGDCGLVHVLHFGMSDGLLADHEQCQEGHQHQQLRFRSLHLIKLSPPCSYIVTQIIRQSADAALPAASSAPRWPCAASTAGP